MAWAVEYSDTALKRLAKLERQTARRILDYMDDRVAAGDPRAIGAALKGPLRKFWRYRIRDHRVICEIIDSRLVVLVLELGDRKDVYR